MKAFGKRFGCWKAKCREYTKFTFNKNSLFRKDNNYNMQL